MPKLPLCFFDNEYGFVGQSSLLVQQHPPPHLNILLSHASKLPSGTDLSTKSISCPLGLHCEKFVINQWFKVGF